MRTTIIAALASASILSSPAALARDVTVEITNLTNAMYFTPLLVAVHPSGVDLFEPGVAASPELQAMAEGGDVSGLADQVEAGHGVAVVDPADGLLAPGASAETTVHLRGRHTRRLSIAAMILPTNDGFVGLDSMRIPLRTGRHVVYLNGYDAGTEANDEIINGGGAPGTPGIPADPGGNGGSGGAGVAGPDHNDTVHVHRGTVGDDDPAGGLSDLDSTVHGWLNPVARVVVTVGH